MRKLWNMPGRARIVTCLWRTCRSKCDVNLRPLPWKHLLQPIWLIKLCTLFILCRRPGGSPEVYIDTRCCMWQQVLWPWQVKTASKKSYNMKFWVGAADACFLFIRIEFEDLCKALFDNYSYRKFLSKAIKNDDWSFKLSREEILCFSLFQSWTKSM